MLQKDRCSQSLDQETNLDFLHHRMAEIHALPLPATPGFEHQRMMVMLAIPCH